MEEKKGGEHKTEPWYKPKKGSVIPAKRKSVTRMMLDSIVQSLLPSSDPPPSTSPAPAAPLSQYCSSSCPGEMADDDGKMMKKKKKDVIPYV